MNTSTVRETAAKCAQDQIAQGWTVDCEEYQLGAFHGDQEALEEALGRDATREELIDFESAIRHVLSGKGAP